MERAEENLDKLQLKVAKSVGREKKVKERRKGWEEVNEAKKKKKGKGNAFEALGEDEADAKKGREWVSDEEMDEDVDGGEVKAPEAVVGETAQVLEVVVPATTVPLPVEEDELL